MKAFADTIKMVSHEVLVVESPPMRRAVAAAAGTISRAERVRRCGQAEPAIYLFFVSIYQSQFLLRF